MNISWLGTRNDDQNADPIFGRKFLGVKAGGSLEVHGPYKKSWTKLNETLVPRPSAFDLSHLDSSPPKGNLNIFVIRITQYFLTMFDYHMSYICLFWSLGVNIFEFDRNTGALIQDIEGLRKMNKGAKRQLDDFSDDLSDDGQSVVVLTKT